MTLPAGPAAMRDIQRLARTDLLNLHTDFDYWNPPKPSEPGDASPRPEAGGEDQGAGERNGDAG